MREVKFKAFLRSNQRLPNEVTLGYKKFPRGIYEVMDLNLASEIVTLWSEKEQTSFEVSFRKVELLQYTGEKDKNSVEIYESYIVKFDPQSPCGDEFYNPRDGEIGEVILDFGSFVIRPIDKKREGLCFSLSELGDWVVLGNIYENPELLQ